MSIDIGKSTLLSAHSKRARTRKYPFDTMAVGDSFMVGAQDYARVSSSAYRYGKRHRKKFSVSSDGSTVRVWRVK